MKLSIVIPSHNVSPRTNLNILNVCSLAGKNLEIVIRDNSGDTNKRQFLSGIGGENCRIIIVDECPGPENTRAAIAAATGEFVFFAADDDHVNGYGIPTLQAEIERIACDPAIIGTSGIVVIEDEKHTGFELFHNLNMPEPLGRFQSLLNSWWPSVFQYSPIRRSVLLNVWEFSSKLPVFVCYHDLLMNCLCLMHGRVTYSERFIYQYSNTNWSNPALHLNSEARSFHDAGLDTSTVRLQWLIAAFEGCRAFTSKYQQLDLAQAERDALGNFWFEHWFTKFSKTVWRQGENSKFDTQAVAISLKWLPRTSIDFRELLTDISEFYALSSPDIAQRYDNFWR